MELIREEFRTVKERVAYFLEEHPETRDNDKLLILAVLVVYYNLKNNVGSYGTIKDYILNGGIPAFATIVRCRAKLQEKRPELRGKKYEERHRRAEVVSDIMTDSDPTDEVLDIFS